MRFSASFADPHRAQRRAADAAPLVALAQASMSATFEFTETPNFGQRTFNMFSASEDSGTVYSGSAHWISYKVTFANSADASFSCFKKVIDRMLA
jgi:hypothetical protein